MTLKWVSMAPPDAACEYPATAKAPQATTTSTAVLIRIARAVSRYRRVTFSQFAATFDLPLVTTLSVPLPQEIRLRP
jgi:hypothetical protein